MIKRLNPFSALLLVSHPRFRPFNQHTQFRRFFLETAGLFSHQPRHGHFAANHAI
jgi:hypothetical protein